MDQVETSLLLERVHMNSRPSILHGGVIAAIALLMALSFLLVGRLSWWPSGSGDGHFPNALEWASPDPWEGETRFLGYSDATAAALDRADQGRKFNENLTFVGPDEESTGNLVVSVRPLDHYRWAATALSSNGECYAMLVVHERDDPARGQTFYAKWSAPRPCSARFATPRTVTSTEPPD